jgi:glucokinase
VSRGRVKPIIETAIVHVAKPPGRVYAEHFLAQPGIALVHATLEKRGPYHYAAFTLACTRLGAACMAGGSF